MKVKEWIIKNLEDCKRDRIYKIELEVTNNLEVIKGYVNEISKT